MYIYFSYIRISSTESIKKKKMPHVCWINAEIYYFLCHIFHVRVKYEYTRQILYAKIIIFI